jgi:hypothetical protein
MKNIEEDKKLIQLKEDAYEVIREFNKASEKLRKGYFFEIDARVREIENRKKEEFLELISKTQLKDSFIEFRFDYDPRHISMRGEVKEMKNPFQNEIYSLSKIASGLPMEKRDHEILNMTDSAYKYMVRSIEHELIEFGLHPSSRPCAYVNVEKFLEKNRISGFIPFLY